MGMYTEVYICSELKKETPMDVIQYMFSNEDFRELKEPSPLPEHPFFKLSRWSMIGRGSSYYHIPFSTRDLRWDEISKSFYLVSRSDLKNYDGEIEAFFDWIMPYLDKQEGEFIGYSRYEESDTPKLYFKTMSNVEAQKG